MKVIFDTNVLIAAFATHGICNTLFEHAIENCDVIISDYILDEFRRTLINKFKMTENKTNTFIEYLNDICQISEYVIVDKQVSRDINDDLILGIINKTKVDFLVTGDQDLLILKEYDKVPIISPRQLWEKFKKMDNK